MLTFLRWWVVGSIWEADFYDMSLAYHARFVASHSVTSSGASIVHSVTSSGTQSETRTPATWYGVLMIWYGILTIWRGVWTMPRRRVTKSWQEASWHEIHPADQKGHLSIHGTSWHPPLLQALSSGTLVLAHVDVGSLKACRRFIWLTMVDGSQLLSVWILEYGSWMMSLPSEVLPVMTMK